VRLAFLAALSDYLIGQESLDDQRQFHRREGAFERLVELVAAGETVCITRRGKSVAQITAIEIPRKCIEPAGLRAMTDAMRVQPETARDFIRRMRDHDRF
jgi:antitoxin (DNA-binding transcriptional repressor) of toxin-antitoxin stability system